MKAVEHHEPHDEPASPPGVPATRWTLLLAALAVAVLAVTAVAALRAGGGQGGTDPADRELRTPEADVDLAPEVDVDGPDVDDERRRAALTPGTAEPAVPVDRPVRRPSGRSGGAARASSPPTGTRRAHARACRSNRTRRGDVVARGRRTDGGGAP